MTPPGRRGRVARVVSGTAHGLLLPVLALPLVSFESHCGPNVDVSGYQALVGFAVPPQVVTTAAYSGPMPSFGPNLWVAFVILAALVGVVAAGYGGPAAVVARMGTAVTATVAVWAAAGSYPSSFGYADQAVYTTGGSAPVLATAVLVIGFTGDCISALLFLDPGRAPRAAPTPAAIPGHFGQEAAFEDAAHPWEAARARIGDSALEVLVSGTTSEDRRAALDGIRLSAWEDVEDDDRVNVDVSGVKLTLLPGSDGDMRFAVAAGELDDASQWRSLCGFLLALFRWTNKPVALQPPGDDIDAIARLDPPDGRVRLTAPSRPTL